MDIRPIATHTLDCDSSLPDDDFDHKTTSRHESLDTNNNDNDGKGGRISTGGSSGSTEKRSISREMSSMGSSPSSSIASWQDFSRKGTQFKALLDEALTKVASTIPKTTTANSPTSQQKLHRQIQPQSSLNEGREDGSSRNAINGNRTPSNNTSNRILQKLVREKQTQGLLLQQKVDSQHSEIAQLQAIADDLRESKKQQAINETRLRMALKRASQNATVAR